MKDFLYFLAAFVVFIAVVKFVFDMRMRKHHGVSRNEFLSAFSGTEIAPEIPAAVYDYYKKMVNFREFSVAPDDTYEMLHKGEEDIEDDARFLMKKLWLKPPSEEIRIAVDETDSNCTRYVALDTKVLCRFNSVDAIASDRS